VGIDDLYGFRGFEIAIRSLTGARALRVVHPPSQVIPAHRHDWPLLTLPALGGYIEECDNGSVSLQGPAAVLHPPGVCHANCIHASGMETFSIEFDQAWLARGGFCAPLDRSFYWIGGGVSLASRSLIQLWSNPQSTDAELQDATAAFLAKALTQPQRSPPPWLDRVFAHLASDSRPTADAIAQRVGMHPRWLTHAYRTAVGEGLHDTILRRRIEHAVHQLRTSDDPIAEIAAVTGFCDQSHLNRVLRRLIGRTPVQIRAERDRVSAVLGTQAGSTSLALAGS
jgi:AraC family transcriptional regulator